MTNLYSRNITHLMKVQNEVYVTVFTDPGVCVILAIKGDNLLPSRGCREESRCSKFNFNNTLPIQNKGKQPRIPLTLLLNNAMITS